MPSCFNLTGVNRSQGLLVNQIIVTKSRKVHVWKPSWTIEIGFNLVKVAAVFVGFVAQNCKIEQLVFDDIKEPWLIHKTIHNLLVKLFFLKGSEHPVPHRKPTSIILVQAVSVCSMMDPMM